MPPKHIARERAWGTRYDTLGISPPSSPPARRSAASENTHSSITPTPVQNQAKGPSNVSAPTSPLSGRGVTQDGAPHDASIFVGSLPATVDHSELTQRLSDHLSAYSQIKAVKVVRDSRGGVCAFVQCDSPVAAGELLQSLQTNPPRPFLGRFLRFEPAKAFRTLLVSYRTPKELVPLSLDDPGASDGNSASSRLAYAMRIFRPRNAKYLGLLYDSDAMNFDPGTTTEVVADSQFDAFSGEGLLLNPLKYDAETLEKLASVFGPLESFRECVGDTYGPCEGVSTIQSSHPYPHNALRSSEMAHAVWEIKWKDREDSVAALLTLRRVPHLTVSWAHHPPSNATLGTVSQKLYAPLQPSPWSPATNRRRPMAPVLHGPALILQPQSIPATLRSPIASPNSPNNSSPKRSKWSAPDPSTMSPNPAGVSLHSTRWADQVAEHDFYKRNAVSSSSLTPHVLSSVNASTAVATTSRSESVLPTERRNPPTCTSALPHTSGTPNFDRFLPLTPHKAGLCKDVTDGGGPSMALEGRADATHTPRAYGRDDRPLMPLPPRDWSKEVDPTTVFVGGLDMPGGDIWDDNKLHRIFNRFGNIENIQLVRPLNKRPAFAFIKFSSVESACHAIQEEHNRLHEGRPIRVQMRDRNPAVRGVWRPTRGRTRALFGAPSSQVAHAPVPCSTLGLRVGEYQAVTTPSVTPIDRPISRSTSTREDVDSNQQSNAGRDLGGSSGFGDQGPYTHGLQDVANASVSSISSGTTKVPSLRYDMSHGAPSTTASSTPPPSSTSVSTSASSSVPMAPYHMNMGFFPPQPWIQPYPTAYPYAVSVVPGYGYPGYHYPPFHPVPPAFFARDANITPTNSISNGTWVAATSDNSVKDIGSSDTPSTTQPTTRPPLQATGFIQNEHGTLIPVYQREALDRYMANAHARQPPQFQPGTPSHSNAAAATPSTSVGWQQSPHFSMYSEAYPVGVQPVASIPPHAQQRYWVPGSVPYATFQASGPHAAPSLVPAAVAPISAHRALHIPTSHGHPQIAQRSGDLPRRFNRRDNYYAPIMGGRNSSRSPNPGNRTQLAGSGPKGFNCGMRNHGHM